GLNDVVLGVLSALEDPLTVRTAAGVWCIAINLVWFGLAYRSRNFRVWELALVLIGGTAALARLGNVWFDGVCLAVRLARQCARGDIRPVVVSAVAGVMVSVVVLVQSRPPALATDAVQVAAQANPQRVLADWRWAVELQQRLPAGVAVL